MHGTCAGMGNSKEENVKDVVFIALENRKRITVNEVLLTFGYKDTIEKRRRKAPVNIGVLLLPFIFYRQSRSLFMSKSYA